MLEGLLWGLLFYTIALIVGLWWYRQYSPLYQRTCFAILVCWIGHFVGTYAYALVPTDSLVYFFGHATNVFTGTGSAFVNNLTWYVREYLTKDSYVGTLYFFSALSFLGSIAWYLLFLQLSTSLKINNQKYMFPALVILCWPSYLFFTAGIGKDSVCFFLLPLILLSLSQLSSEEKNRVSHLFILVFSVLLASMIRPYLLMILVAAYFFATVRIKQSLFHVILIIVSIPILYYAITWVVAEQSGMIDIGVMDVALRAQQQQESLSAGTSFPRLSGDPRFVLLSLPYTMIMNLTMPLFFLANNSMGIIASVENVFLVWLLYQFLKNRRIYNIIKVQNNAVKFCFTFFLVGMAFLGLVNSNLGLAARQKSMYVPAFLVVAMLVWLYKKQAKSKRLKSGA